MTKIFLPTELGVKGEGSNSTIEDKHTPDVHEVNPGEEPAVKDQPEFYKGKFPVEGDDLTMAERRAGVDNTRNQAEWDKSPKVGKAQEERKPVEVGEASKTTAADVKSKVESK